MNLISALYSKVKGLIDYVVTYWKKPPKGQYVSNKEILNYSLGGMGIMLVSSFIAHFAIGAGSLLLGAAIGLRPMHLQTLATVLTVIQFFMYIIRGKIVDNTRTKWGRFRPYIALGSIPVMILAIIFLFINFEHKTYNEKLILTMIFCISIYVLMPFFTDSHGELRSVITPNSAERTKIISVSQIIASFAPTIVNLFFPILSDLTGGLTKINTYRYIALPMGVIGVFMALFCAFGTKERVVMSKNYVQKSSIFRDMSDVWRNKYWWIRHISGLVGAFEGAYGAIFGWMFVYGTQNMAAYGVLQTVLGTASLISMVITPYLLRLFGNRRLMLIHNALNVVLIGIMCVTFSNWVIFFILYYINTIINQLTIVYDPAIHAEVKDYQQYISDKRMDFTFGAAGQITLPIGIALGYVIPIIYEAWGITTNFDILYDPRVRYEIFYILCGISVLGAAMNLIPLFFFRLSRQKHRIIVAVLRYRATLIDYYLTGDSVSPYAVKELVEDVNMINETTAMESPNIKEYKAALKQAYLMPKKNAEETQAYKEALKQAKAMPKDTYENRKARNEAILVSKELLVTKNERKAAIKKAFKEMEGAENILFLKDGIKEIWNKELSKYDNDFEQVKICCYEKLSAVSPNELINLTENDFTACLNCLDGQSKTLITGKPNKDYIKAKKFYAKFIKQLNKMKNKIVKIYGAGEIIVPDPADIEIANALPSSTKEEIKFRKQEISRLEKINKDYSNAVQLYLNVNDKLLKYRASKLYDEVAALYERSVADVMRIDEETRLREEQEDAAKKEEFARLKQERQNKKEAKKNRYNSENGGDQ